MVALWAILLPTVFASLYYAINHNVLYGFLLGAAIASIPIAIGAVKKTLLMPRLTEWMILLVTIAVSVVVAYKITMPILEQVSFALEQLLPLLASMLALYILYMFLGRIVSENNGSRSGLIARVESALAGPPMLLTISVAIVISTYLLIVIHNIEIRYPEFDFIANKFLDRGIIPPLTVVLFCWGLIILASKALMLWGEWRLTSRPQDSLLFSGYLETMRRSGNATTDIYINLMWRKSSDFYVVSRYINWAIPILGFIGTVLGISLAAEGIQAIIGGGQGLAQLSSDLSNAISPLGIAFDTTLIALSLSVVLTLIQTVVQRWENSIITEYENLILSSAD